MSMKQQLTEDMKAAMKAGEKHKLGVIRLINAAIKQREVDERIELDDTAVIAVLDKMVKQRKDSVSQYEAANREDLAEIERAEIVVIEAYLPAKMGEAEIVAAIRAAITETGASGPADMGKLMGALKPARWPGRHGPGVQAGQAAAGVIRQRVGSLSQRERALTPIDVPVSPHLRRSPATTAHMVEPELNVPVSLHKYLKRLQDSFPMAVAKRFIDVDVLTQAASVSFYALLSMAPLLVLLLWLTASLYPPAQQALVDQISSVAGSSAAIVAETVLKNADNQPDVGSLAGLWSTLLLFVGATAVFAQLQNALNLIFRTSGERLEGLKAAAQARVLVRRGAGPGLPADPVDDCHHGTAGGLRATALDPPRAGLRHQPAAVRGGVRFHVPLPARPPRGVAPAFIGGAITSALFALGRYGIGVYIATVAPAVPTARWVRW